MKGGLGVEHSEAYHNIMLLNGNTFLNTGPCEGNPLVFHGFFSQRLVMQSLDVSFDVSVNRLLNKHMGGQ